MPSTSSTFISIRQTLESSVIAPRGMIGVVVSPGLRRGTSSIRELSTAHPGAFVGGGRVESIRGFARITPFNATEALPALWSSRSTSLFNSEMV